MKYGSLANAIRYIADTLEDAPTGLPARLREFADELEPPHPDDVIDRVELPRPHLELRVFIGECPTDPDLHTMPVHLSLTMYEGQADSVIQAIRSARLQDGEMPTVFVHGYAYVTVDRETIVPELQQLIKRDQT